MQIHTIGIDLGKTVFHLVGLNLCGEAVVRRKCSRTQLVQFPEACDSAQMIRSLEVEDLEGTMALRCKEQAIVIIIGSKVIEIAGVAGQINTLNQLDGTSLLRYCSRAQQKD